MRCFKNSSSVVAIAIALTFPVAAFAQDADTTPQATEKPAPPTDGIADIVVTARRQNERLIEVPASVSVLSGEAIERTGVKVAADFVQLTPGVTIVTGNVEAADTQINIRGMNGARDAESNVALVVDGILKTNTSSLNQDQGSLAQVEVLKGPQGAIYGRNAAAGAIVITTVRPGPDLRAKAKVSVANNNTYTGAATVSGPLSGQVGFVIGGDYARSDGFFRNSFLSSPAGISTYPLADHKAARIDNFERFNVNGRLLIEPAAGTEIDLKARYGEQTSGAIAFNAIFQIPVLAGLFGPDFNIDANEHKFIFSPNVAPRNRQTTLEASARLETDLDFAKLTSFVAFNKINNYFYADGTSGTFGFFNEQANCAATLSGLSGTPVQSPFGIGGGAFLPPYSPTTCDGTQFQQRNQWDLSTEIRLSGDRGPVTWQFGGYYLRIERDVCLNLGVDTGAGVVAQCFTTDPRNPTEALADDSFATNVYAAFGSIDWKPSDQFKVGLAARYDIEDRSVVNNIPTNVRTRWVGNVLTGFPNGTATTPANYYLNPSLDPAYNPSGVLAPRSATFRQLQPKVSLSWTPSRDFSVYANWGVGFKSGGFNASGSQTIIDQFFNNQFGAGLSIYDQYAKERSSSFETGLKWQAPGARASFELAAYRTDVRNMQFFEFFVGPFGLLRVVSNIDKVRLQGIEAAFTVRPVDGWSIFGSGNLIDSKIRQNSSRPYTVGNKSPYTADYTLNLGTQIERPISSTADLLLRADYRLTGPTWFHTVQDNDVPNIFGLQGNFKNSQRDAYGVVNLRGGIKTGSWSLMGFANNLLGKKYLAEVIPAPEFGGDFLTPGAPASYGIEASIEF